MFSEKQKKLIQANFIDNSFEVLEGSVRSGKTTCLCFRFARFLVESDDSDFLILGYNQEQTYKLVCECNGFGLLHIFPNSKIKDNAFGKHLLLKFPEGVEKRVYIKGGGKADDYKRFQGLSLGGVLMTELPLLHMDVIQETFRRTMASKLRVNFADMNPPSPMHPVIKEVLEVQNTIWSHWTMADNPILTDERKNEIRKTLEKNPYLYRRDWLGERVAPQGLIYSVFSHGENIVKGLQDDERIQEVFYAGDYGMQDATSIGCFIVARSYKHGVNLYLYAEYYYSGSETGIDKPVSDQSIEIKQFIKQMDREIGRNHTGVYIDPSALVLRAELRKVGIECQSADNNSRDIVGSRKGLKVGIERLQNSIADRTFKIIERDDQYGHLPFLKELSLYSLDTNGEPTDAYNHCCDMIRYGHNYYFKSYKPIT